MKYKKYFFITSIVTGMFLLTVAMFNYRYDSYGFFHTDTGISYAAKALAEGNSVVGLENYDERLFQKQIYENFIERPACIAVGSSRSMMITSSDAECKGRFFNHAVSDASLEDDMAITAMYDKDELPKKIIFGIDPWIFNKKTGRTDWKVLKEDFVLMLSKLHNVNEYTINEGESKYFQLLNYDNTLYNWKNLKNGHNISIVSTDAIDGFIKRRDGSIVYPHKIRYQKDEETQRIAYAFVANKVYNLENFDELSNQQLFENFIDYLQKQNVEVEFFLPPYHPIVYQYFLANEKYKKVLDAERYLRTFAIKKRIRVYGSYNPAVFHLTSTDFTDAIHPKQNAIDQIFGK